MRAKVPGCLTRSGRPVQIAALPELRPGHSATKAQVSFFSVNALFPERPQREYSKRSVRLQGLDRASGYCGKILPALRK